MSSSSTRVLLTVLISLGILLGWQYFFAPKTPPPSATKKEEPKKSEPKSEPQETASSQPAGNQPASSQPTGNQAESGQPTSRPTSRPTAATEKKLGPRARSLEGEKLTLKRDGLTVTFTTTGAALRHLRLTGSRFREPRDGKLVAVDLVRTTAGRGPWPLTTIFPRSDFDVPANARFSVVSQGASEVRYAWQSEKVRVTKHYMLDPVRTLIWLTIEVQNRTAGKLRGRLEASVYNQPAPEQGKASFTNPYPVVPTVSCYANGELFRRSIDAILGKESSCSAAGCGMGDGPIPNPSKPGQGVGEVSWVGSDDRYFLTAIAPQDGTEERRCELKLLGNNIVQGSLLYPESVIDAGKTKQYRFLVFAGPKDLKALDSVKTGAGTEAHLGDAIDFGWFAVLCRPMLWLMKIFHSWFGNWGIAIILLTVVVKLLTLYWTQKSMRSMKEMQRLKPKIDVLREKYASDKQRLNQEMMALYKLHKVNPLGGCLPMLIQMPIWFALYRTLGNSVELYHSSFFGWITDLTAPDQYYVLPIAMGVAMYAQQAITPQPVEGTQAKVMKYFMPGMFTVMMLALPAGLTLYIFVNTVLTMIHQWYMNKTDPHRDEKPAAPTGGVSKGDGRGDGGKPKQQQQQRRRQKPR